MTHRAFPWRILLAATFLLLLGSPGAAQEERPTSRRTFLEGSHAFRRMLGDYGLRPLKSAQEISEDPARTLLIVLGDLNPLDELPTMSLNVFFWRGGAALIASDQRSASNQLAATLRFTINGGSVRTMVPERMYREMPECPLLVPSAIGDDPDGLRAKLFSRLERVATNNPSTLSPFRGNPEVFGENRIRVVAGVAEFLQWRGLPVAAGGIVRGQGRALLIADHSIFINEMLMQHDNDNVFFTLNAIDWLTEIGKRDRVLFVENGVVKDSFDVPLEEPQLPPLPSLDYLVPLMNKALAGMQDEGIFTHILDQLLPANRLLRWLAVGATLALMGYLMLQLGRARQRIDTSEPVLALVLAQQPQPTLALEQRNLSMLADGNLYDAARHLARQEVVRLLGRPLPPIDQELPAGIMTPPPLVVQGSWWQRWRWQRRWRTLWQLALGATPVWISPRRFQRLSQQLQDLRTAAAKDRIHVDRPPA